MEFSRPAKSGQAKPSIKCKFWKRRRRPTAAGNGGGFGGLRPRADGAWAAAGMAVEGLLEGERRLAVSSFRAIARSRRAWHARSPRSQAGWSDEIRRAR